MYVLTVTIAGFSLLYTAIMLKEFRRTTSNRKELLLALGATEKQVHTKRTTLMWIYILSSVAWSVGLIALFKVAS